MAQQARTRAARLSISRAYSHFFGEYNRDQKLFILEAMLVNSANVITGGVFLTGMLVKMGASDFLVGLVSSSPTWALLLSLVSSVIMESVRRKKALITWVLLAFRLLTTLPALFLPTILGTGPGTMMLACVMLVAGNLIYSVYNTGFFIFFMDSLPMEGRVNYIYSRMFFLRIAYSVCLVAMGFLLDILNKSDAGFAIVFAVGLLLGLADVLVITRIRGNQESAVRTGGSLMRLGLRAMGKRLLEPLGNIRFRRYLLFTFAFFFFFFMASSYTSLYQYSYLDLSMAFISIYNACTYVIMILATKRWGAVEKKIGKLNVMALSAAVMSLDFLVYAFLTKSTLWVIAFSPVFSGLGASAYWSCALPFRYEMMPPEGKTVYEGWNGMAFGAAGLLGTVSGGGLQQAMRPVASGFFSVFQLIYLGAFALSLLSAVVFWLRARSDARLAEGAEEARGVSLPQ